MKMGLAAAIAKGALLLLFGQSLAAQAAEVKVFSGGGFTSVMTELVPVFERTTGHKVVTTFGSNDALERRIKAGESFDALLIEPMKPKLKPTGVAHVVKAAASGEADLVVHVIPGILAERGVELVGPLPAEIQSYIDLTAGLSAATKEPEAGKAFITFLTSDAAIPVIRAKGW